MSDTTVPVVPIANAGHAIYPGDVRHMVGQVKGPNLLGEFLTAVTADYDPAAGKTRVGFTFARRWATR